MVLVMIKSRDGHEPVLKLKVFLHVSSGKICFMVLHITLLAADRIVFLRFHWMG